MHHTSSRTSDLGASPISDSAFPSIDFLFARESAELPTHDPILEPHATSSLFLMLQPGSRSSAVTALSSGVALKTPQTTCSVAHPLVSC